MWHHIVPVPSELGRETRRYWGFLYPTRTTATLCSISQSLNVPVALPPYRRRYLCARSHARPSPQKHYQSLQSRTLFSNPKAPSSALPTIELSRPQAIHSLHTCFYFYTLTGVFETCAAASYFLVSAPASQNLSERRFQSPIKTADTRSHYPCKPHQRNHCASNKFHGSGSEPRASIQTQSTGRERDARFSSPPWPRLYLTSHGL